jgi:hypothetical protein
MSTDPEQIRSEIDQTQRELSADVDALTEKVSPPRAVERQVRRTRTAMTNVKEKIMGSTASGASSVYQTARSAGTSAGEAISSTASATQDTAASAADAARSAPELVRRRTEGNPLAVGLIAFGAGWLLSSLMPATEPEQRVASQVKDFATEQGRPVARQLGEAGQEAAQQLRESAQQRAEAVKDTATEAASRVAGDSRSATGHVTGQAQQAADTVREQASPSSR